MSENRAGEDYETNCLRRAKNPSPTHSRGHGSIDTVRNSPVVGNYGGIGISRAENSGSSEGDGDGRGGNTCRLHTTCKRNDQLCNWPKTSMTCALKINGR